MTRRETKSNSGETRFDPALPLPFNLLVLQSPPQRQAYLTTLDVLTQLHVGDEIGKNWPHNSGSSSAVLSTAQQSG